MSVTKWVLIDETNGATCGDGSKLDPTTLQRIAVACDAQLNNEYSDEYGGQFCVRAGKDSTDVQPGEQVYAFVPSLAQAPGASAYHDTDGNGVPVSYCAVETCSSLLGPSGISVDASHELLEAAADPSCNLMADNLAGMLIAYEVGDPVEVQTYASSVDPGVQLSNFVLRSWFNTKASAPFDYMSKAGILGAVAPPGPLQIAPGNGGNYYITETCSENYTNTFGVRGKQRKARRDTGSRFMRRLMARQVSQRGAMAIGGARSLRSPGVDLRPPPEAPAPTLGEAALMPPTVAEQRGLPPHQPPGTVERVGMHQVPSAGTPKRPQVNPVSVQRAKELEESGTLSEEGVQAAKNFMTRTERRANRPAAQHDPQQAVLAGRRQIRDQQK